MPLTPLGLNGVWGGAPAIFLRLSRPGVWGGDPTPCVHDPIKPAGLVRHRVVKFVWINPVWRVGACLRSTVTQLLETLNDWTVATDSGQVIDVLYIDICKASDSLPHSKLLSKLEKYGISCYPG